MNFLPLNRKAERNEEMLRGCNSKCKPKQAIIISREGTKEHRAINQKKNYVSQYKIDGEVIKHNSMKCDYLVLNEDKREAYLIELKGSDISHAIDQLEATEKELRNELNIYYVKYRIICSKAKTQATYDIKYKKFKNKHKRQGEFFCKEIKFEEYI